MKSILLTSVLFFSLAISNAQTTHSFSTFKNEIGTDVTALLGNFLGPDYYYDPYFYYYPYTPQFAFAYRHYFSNSGIKAMVNASMFNNTNTTNDSTSNKLSNSTVSIVLGYEWSIPLSKMWEVYVGPDLHFATSGSESSYENESSGYRYSYESSSVYYGLGPTLGIRWNFSERLSLSTESSLTYLMSSTTSKNFYEPLTDGLPEIDDVNTESESTQMIFSVPHSIFFNLRF